MDATGLETPIAPGPWDGFLAGEENALALAGVMALARGEREGLSPLVLHGPSGVGKSRLLAGLVAERLSGGPSRPWREVEARRSPPPAPRPPRRPEAWAEVRERFRHVDLLASTASNRWPASPPGPGGAGAHARRPRERGGGRGRRGEDGAGRPGGLAVAAGQPAARRALGPGRPAGPRVADAATCSTGPGRGRSPWRATPSSPGRGRRRLPDARRLARAARPGGAGRAPAARPNAAESYLADEARARPSADDRRDRPRRGAAVRRPPVRPQGRGQAPADSSSRGTWRCTWPGSRPG